MTALADTPVLTTERLTLRAPQAGDWPAWRDFAASERARYILDGNTDPAFAWRVFGHAVGHWVLRGFGMFVFTLRGDDRPLGKAGPWFPEGWPEREIGWSIWSADAEGRGFATEAVRAVRDHAFHAMGWNTAVSYIDARNQRSIALAERLGASLDPAARAPSHTGDATVLVYRHPAGERGNA